MLTALHLGCQQIIAPVLAALSHSPATINPQRTTDRGFQQVSITLHMLWLTTFCSIFSLAAGHFWCYQPLVLPALTILEIETTKTQKYATQKRLERLILQYNYKQCTDLSTKSMERLLNVKGKVSSHLCNVKILLSPA